jgi:hypothetical protein
MTGKRRITFRATELLQMQHALASRIDVCMFEIGRSRTRDERNAWAMQCAYTIAAYRKSYGYPSSKSLVEQIANRQSERLARALMVWDEQHGVK